MTKDNENNENDENKKGSPVDADEKDDLNQSGDPGRTPGAAEGDEETIDEDIKEKEAEGKL